MDPEPDHNEETEVQAIAIVPEAGVSHEQEKHQSQIVVDNNKQPAPEPEDSVEPPPPYMPAAPVVPAAPAAPATPAAPAAQAEMVHHMWKGTGGGKGGEVNVKMNKNIAFKAKCTVFISLNWC